MQEIVAAAFAGEIRTVAADRLWMSTAYDQASVAPPLHLEAHSGRRRDTMCTVSSATGSTGV